jgi:acyl-CoA thioesterase-1
MNDNCKLSPSFVRWMLLLLVLLSLQALIAQVSRSAQAWSWRGLVRPAVYGLEFILWIGLFVLSYFSLGERLLKQVEHTVSIRARWKGWNWLALLVLAALYPLARLSASAALIQRFIPPVWLWGHIVLVSTLILWVAWPGKPGRRLLICALMGIILWQAVELTLTSREAALAAQNPPRPPFVVAYLGGSITAGDGASDPEQTSWRALTSSWLQTQDPEIEVISIKAGVPGTGSALGVFRLQEDVLQYNPNLVFIEFAVNDADMPEELSFQALESIVRKIRTSLSYTRIIFVFTTTRGLSEAYDRRDLPKAIKWQVRLAQYYGIPTINVGRVLWQEVAAGRETWEDLTRDGVHPTDQGYQIYFEAIREALQASPFFPERLTLPLPAALSTLTLENARIIPASQLEAPGWKLSEAIYPRPYSTVLESDQVGARFTYAFTGRAAGIYWRLAPDGGEVAWSVDGGPEQIVDTWGKVGRNSYSIFAWGLSPGRHELSLRILSTRNPASNGKHISILGFLWGE